MKICLVGSILRQTIITDKEKYSGWGGMTESAVAPLAVLFGKNSTIYFVGSLGKEDIGRVKEFYNKNYPMVDHSGIFINPTGTDHHIGSKHFVTRKIQVQPTRYEHVRPYINKSDVVIFNFGNIDDIDPEAIKLSKQNSKALVYVDVHRKPFGADQKGRMYARGWPGWENYLKYADHVQMNRQEAKALLGGKMRTMGDVVRNAKKILAAGVRNIIITLGGAGALFANRSLSSYEYFLVPAISCKIVDTTGCGDAFAAGYLFGLGKESSYIYALKWGSLMAAVNCEFLGYIKNITKEEIEKRMPQDFNVVRVNPNDKTIIANY